MIFWTEGWTPRGNQGQEMNEHHFWQGYKNGDVDEKNLCKNLLERMIHCLKGLHYHTTSYITFGYCIMSADVQHNFITN